jgi:hypothetical protein
MMDYYSNFPPPSREEAIKEVIKEFNGEEVREIVEKAINGMPSLGSYTGWYVGFKMDAIKMVKDEKERIEKERIDKERIDKERLDK